MSQNDMSTSPTSLGRLRAALGVLAALALAIPASATAHPGVYTVEAKLATPGITYESDKTGTGLNTQTQYAIANDGWAKAFAESNGLVSGGGMINYKTMPSGYRNGTSAEPPTTPMTFEEKRTYVPAQTDVQAHATCDLAELKTGSAILAWQGDPFFNYVPWQKGSAGLGDEPSKWIPVVLEETGVDLATLPSDNPATKEKNEEAEAAEALCVGKGGTYYKSDTPSVIDAEAIASAVEPVQAQVNSLLSENGSLQAQIASWQARNGILDGEKTALVAERDALAAQLKAANAAKAKKDRKIKSLRKQLNSLRGHMH